MNNKLLLIFQSIQTIHELEKEFSKRFGWLRFKEKKECKKLKEKLIEQINSLYADKWTVEYLHKIEKSIEAYYIYIEEFLGQEMYIAKEQHKEQEQSRDVAVFLPIYFIDPKNENRLIILDIIGNNIEFRIMDTETGNSFTTSSTDEVQLSQKKIERVCKYCLVKTITRYLNNEKNLLGYEENDGE